MAERKASAERMPKALAVVLAPIDSVKPHPRNYNGHSDSQVDGLVRSYQRFGQLRNIVVRRGKIIAGEGWWRAMKKAGAKRIAVYDISHLTESEALAFMVADNELARLADPDPVALSELIEQAQSHGEPVPGVSEERRQELLKLATPEDPEFKEKDESAGREVQYCTCPKCGHKFPK